MSMVREAEAIQVWNTNIRALMLYPGIRSHLTAQLLIHFSRVIDFSQLVWHRSKTHELLVAPRRSYLDRYAYIEAATNPSSLCIDSTDVSIGEPQVVPDKCLNGLPLIPE